MKCLVTGAAGFVGSTLTDRLLQEGHHVVGVDSFVDYYPRTFKDNNLSSALKNSHFQFIEGDLMQLELKPLLQGVDWVFHQAAQAGVRASWGAYFDTYCRNNILATQRLLEAARESVSIKKIVFASSSSVYGNAESMPTSETAVPKPVSPYGVTKLASEHLMSLYAIEAGLPTVSLRYFTVFGPRQRPDMAFHRIVRAAIEGKEFLLYGDGEQSRDFTHIDDIVEANILAAQKGKGGQVFNIGGGPHATVNEALEVISSFGSKLNIKRLDRQAGDARHTSADISLARNCLGFVPRVSLQDGLRSEYEWMKQLLQTL